MNSLVTMQYNPPFQILGWYVKGLLVLEKGTGESPFKALIRSLLGVPFVRKHRALIPA